jgi:16S rRNA U1498 N3-methylase RsmE
MRAKVIELKEGDSLMLVTKHEVLICTITGVRQRHNSSTLRSEQADSPEQPAVVELVIDTRLDK